MTNEFRARRLRNIAWRMHLWQAPYLICCVQLTDYTMLNACRSAEESWLLNAAPLDVQILFVLFVAEAIEQGDF